MDTYCQLAELAVNTHMCKLTLPQYEHVTVSSQLQRICVVRGKKEGLKEAYRIRSVHQDHYSVARSKIQLLTL